MSIIITIIIAILIFNALTKPTSTLSSPLSGSIATLDNILNQQLAKDEATIAHIQSTEYQDALNEEYATKMRNELQATFDFSDEGKLRTKEKLALAISKMPKHNKNENSLKKLMRK